MAVMEDAGASSRVVAGKRRPACRTHSLGTAQDIRFHWNLPIEIGSVLTEADDVRRLIKQLYACLPLELWWRAVAIRKYATLSAAILRYTVHRIAEALVQLYTSTPPHVSGHNPSHGAIGTAAAPSGIVRRRGGEIGPPGVHGIGAGRKRFGATFAAHD